MSEIRECPLCGKKAEIEREECEYEEPKTYISCSNCGVSLPCYFESSAIKLWNTRAYDAELTRQQQEIERLRRDSIIKAFAASELCDACEALRDATGHGWREPCDFSCIYYSGSAKEGE